MPTESGNSQRVWKVTAAVAALSAVAATAFAVGRGSPEPPSTMRAEVEAPTTSSVAVPLASSTTVLVTTTTTPIAAPAVVPTTSGAPRTTTSRPAATSTTRVPVATPTTTSLSAHSLTGGVVLANSGTARTCGMPDVVPARQVVIKDATGVIIKVASVGTPFRSRSGSFSFCTFPFSAELPDSTAYIFSADGEPPTTVGREEMIAKNWNITLIEFG